MRKWAVAALCVIAGLVAASSAHAAEWHRDGWSRRAVVSVASSGNGGTDVAAVRIRHAGAAQKGGDDYRIHGPDGEPVPYQITYHHPGRDTLISFRAEPGRTGPFFIYYGNADASRSPRRARSTAPGGGPPEPGPKAGGWIPRTGLVMKTMRRPKETPNPESVSEMRALIEQSPGLDGGRYVRSVSSGLNPFGDSEHYITVYRGWMHVDKPGEYGLCTASNEASFTFLDGEGLVHWPGRHTEKRGRRGQFNATRKLSKGPHYVEYLHEEVMLYQTAFLGYKPPGAGYYKAILKRYFPAPREAEVRRYETSGGKPSVTIRPELVDSVWPKHHPTGQFTRYRFTADAGREKTDLSGWDLRWSFGDGASATGRTAEHVYLRNGDYKVMLRAKSPDGRTMERVWSLTVYPIEHLKGPYKDGKLSAYVPIVSEYSPKAMRSRSLGALIRFAAEADERKLQQRASEQLLDREDVPATARVDARLAMAGPAGDFDHAWDGTLSLEAANRAAEHLSQAAEVCEEPPQRMRILARLVRVRGVDASDLEGAQKALQRAEGAVEDQPLTGELRRAYRRVEIAMGDAHLHARHLSEASRRYRRAEKELARRVHPKPVRAAKIGSYPETITQNVQKGRVNDAWRVLHEWRWLFPADHVRGEPLFWLGKLQLERGHPARAVTPLKMAIDLSRGAAFEAEARWRLAECFGKLGRPDDRRAALHELVEAGLTGPYRKKAKQALSE